MSSLSAQQLDQIVRGIQDLGLPFDEGQIKYVLKQCKYNQESATNYLLEASMSGQVVPSLNQGQPQSTQQNPYQASGGANNRQPARNNQSAASQNTHQIQTQDSDVIAAIQASLKSEPLTLDRRLRQDGTPVGLKNVGNTCYFNSFIQAFFFMPNMNEKMLFTQLRAANAKPQQVKEGEDAVMKAKRKEHSVQMAKELQYLFAKLLYTNQNYVDPSDVLNNVYDDSGHQCQVGDQQDSMEYLMNFMERLEEGLSEESMSLTKHMRVSTYRKSSQDHDKDNPSESLLFDDTSDLAESQGTDSSDANQTAVTSAAAGGNKLAGYSHIEDSYFQHAATQNKPPVQQKPMNVHNNTIQENFFGSYITVTKLLNKETNKEKVISKHCQKMGPVMLDIDNGRLMDDWEQSCRNEVTDYKAGQSEVCINESWVKDPPNILIFTLNRVKYDKEQLKLVKDFKKFEFDKTIHVDQLLEGNIGRIDGVRERTRRLKQEIKTLRKQLDACKQDSILESLQNSLDFLQGQMEAKLNAKSAAEEVKQQAENFKPASKELWSNLKGVDFQTEQLQSAQKLLASYKQAVAEKMAAIEADIKTKVDEVRTAFGDYCNIPYYLHAILIHDGTAESGHYYSFIYDRKQDVWWRFSDVNVSIEIEEVVFKEAFGGQIASTKTAYSLIYINEYCKSQMEQKNVAPFMMGKQLNVSADLKNRIIVDNNAFSQAHEQFCARKTVEAIRRRYYEKKRQVEENKTNLNQMLHVPLLNLIYHLYLDKKVVFAEWLMLNQATSDELGEQHKSLRGICEHKDSVLYIEMEKEFRSGFMNMSAKDEQSLDVHKRSFKEEKRRYLIVTMALKTFCDDIQNWRPTLASIQHMQERQNANPKRKSDSLDSLLLDLIRVYVLDSLTTTMKLVLAQQGEQAVRIHSGAAIACYQFLAKDDVITKQAIKYTERIIDSAKRIPAVANFKQAFELAISKMKRPDRLERTDFIQSELTPQAVTEIEAIKMKNEEIADPELWNTESLCFTYFNILIQYRTTKQNLIEWLRLTRDGPASDSQLLGIEKRLGINVAAFR